MLIRLKILKYLWKIKEQYKNFTIENFAYAPP